MTVAQCGITEGGRGHLLCSQEGLYVIEKGGHAGAYKCVAAHRQGVFKRTLPPIGGMCDTAHMQPDNELDRVRIALKQVMERKGARPKPLAKKAGLGDTSIRDILDNPERDIKVGTLQKIAAALDTNIEELLGSETIPLSGRVGAGGSVIYDEADKEEIVPRPSGFGVEIEALEVIGQSMLPRYSSGDIVYISRTHEGAKPEYFGDYCAVRLTSGETYVKILARGSRPGFFTLRSLNADDIEDVEIEWATPILASISRAARRMLGY